MARVGGVDDSVGFQNSVEIDELAIFAVNEHNTKEVRVSSSNSIVFTFFPSGLCYLLRQNVND